MVISEALQEMEAQILCVLEAGVAPTHMDHHMGCYLQPPDLRHGAMRLAKKYNLPMNPIHIQEMRQQGYVVADAMWGFTSNLLPEVADPGIRKRAYDNWMRRLKPGVHLLLTHIARVSDDYRSMIQGAYFRQGDYTYWTSTEAASLAEELGITFIGYRELQELQATNWDLEESAEAGTSR